MTPSHSFRTWSFAAAALAAVAVMGSAFVAAPVSAADEGNLRVAHLSPEAPGVDVSLTPVGSSRPVEVVRGVRYGGMSPYLKVRPGRYTVSARWSGAPAGGPAVASTSVEVTAGSAHTVASVARGLKVLADDLAPPETGLARVRVIHASSSARLDVVAESGPVFTDRVDLAATSRYADVPAGTWTLKVGQQGRAATSVNCTVHAGGVYSVLILDGRSGGLEVVTRADAQGAELMPAGTSSVPAPERSGGAFADAVFGLVTAAFGALVLGAAVAVQARRRVRFAVPG